MTPKTDLTPFRTHLRGVEIFGASVRSEVTAMRVLI